MVNIGHNLNSKVASEIAATRAQLKNGFAGNEVTPKTAAAAQAARGQYLGPAVDVMSANQLSPDFLSKYLGANITYVTNNYYGDVKNTTNTVNAGDHSIVTIGNQNDIAQLHDEHQETMQKGFGHKYCRNNHWNGYYGPPIKYYPPAMPPCIGAPPMPIPLPPGALPEGHDVKPYDVVQVGLVMAGLPPVSDLNAPPLQAPPMPPEAVGPVRTGGFKPAMMAFADVAPVEDTDAEAKKAEELALQEAALADGMA